VSELILRAGVNDHLMLADVMAPGGGVVSLRGLPPIARLVVDAQVAKVRPQLASTALQAGIPFIVDPLTPLLEGTLRDDDSWALLPFGQSEPVRPWMLEGEQRRLKLIDQVVEFEVEHGASAIVPPYLYSSSPQDPRFELNLAMIRTTATYLQDHRIPLPTVPILAAQLHRFSPPEAWGDGIDRFKQLATEIDSEVIALCMSPVGDSRDSYNKLLSMFNVAQRMQQGTKTPVVAWRQGTYGEALVAAGLGGYETGAGTREQTNISRLVSSRRPSPDGKKSGGPSVGVFLEPLGRSVPKPAAQTLLGTLQMRAKVMCDDESCCPYGPISTLDRPREHAIRTRARTLAEIDSMPERKWRLHKTARKAELAVAVTNQANQALREEGYKTILPTRGMESLGRVAEYLLDVENQAAS
jgi:hypothetical protein